MSDSICVGYKANPGFTKEAKSPDGTPYKAFVSSDGILEVHQVTPRELRIEQHSADGSVAVNVVTAETAKDSMSKDLLAYMNRTPLFKCACDKGSDGTEWWCDIDCGFQRWHGVKPRRDVATALKNCGFNTQSIRAILRHCAKFEHEYLGRCG